MTPQTGTAKTRTSKISDRELMLTRDYDAPREALYRAWTDPETFMRFIAPRPYTTTVAEFDVRPGGRSFFLMKSPEGEEIPCPGLYLEVVPNERLVMTDAYVEAWKPSDKPFMTTVLTFEDLGGGRTRYTARVRHWSAEDCAAHEKMGFHEGWSQVAEQLAEVVEGRQP